MTMLYIQLKEASQLTGMNEMTIRRLAKKPESRQYVKREDNKIFIQQEYLYKHYPPTTPKLVGVQELKQDIVEVEQDVQDLSRHPYIQQIIAAKEDIIEVLKEEVERKERMIIQVTERSREQNRIIQSLQEKLTKQLPVTTEVNITGDPNKKAHKPARKSYDKTDYLYIGIAIVAWITLLAFVGLMLLTYFKNNS